MEDIFERMKERVKRNAFAHHNFLELEAVEKDRAVVRLAIRPESKNPGGMVHGGAMFTMADNATGIAVHTDGRSYVTQNGSLHFIANQPEGTIRATAQVRHRGKKTALAVVDITNEGGKLLATGEYTFFCVGETQK